MAQLRRFYTRVTDSDNAAVASPTVTLLRVGALVTRDATGGVPQVGVRHPGALVTNDVCYVLRGGALIDGLTVTMADPSWTYDSGNGDWYMEYVATGASWTPTAGDRLVLTGLAAGHKVSVYDNDIGAGSSGDPTVGSDGVVSGYVDAVDVDVKLVSGSTTSYVTDVSTDGRGLSKQELAGSATTEINENTQFLVITGTGTAISKIRQCRDGRVLRVMFSNSTPNTLSAAATPADDEILVGLSPTRYKVYTLVGWDDGTYTRWTLGD